MVFVRVRSLAVPSVTAVYWCFWRRIRFITRKDYSSITGLLKNKALNDLNLLVEKGYLSTIGRGSHKVYVRGESQEIKSENA